MLSLHTAVPSRAQKLVQQGVRLVPPCINVHASTEYLNNPHVRTALHIPAKLPAWEICRYTGEG